MSELAVSTNQYRRCDLISLNGRVDSDTAGQLREAFEAITEAGRFKIVLNLAGVPFMSSAGFRVLIETIKICKRFNRGNLILAEVPDPIQNALQLAGLDAIFTTFAKEVEAVASF